MSAYNVIAPASLVSGQPEDISQVLANFNAIATVINGNLDNANVVAGANLDLTKLASAGTIGASAVTIGANFIKAAGYFESDVAAVGNTAFQSVVAGEGSPHFYIDGDGKHHWGLGGATAADTDLFRSAASQLKTDGAFITGGTIYPSDNTTNDGISFRRSVGASMGSIAFLASLILGDANSFFVVRANGQMQWGPGGATPVDTTLYRVGLVSAMGVLGTDGSFQIGSAISAQWSGAPVIALSNATTIPASNPANGGTLYAQAGALKWRGSAGTITTIAAA